MLARPPRRARVAEREQLDRTIAKARRAVLNHAYGLVSRGNTGGGLAHIAEYLTEVEPEAEVAVWFFNEIANWEYSHAALVFGQSLIERLQELGREAEANKLSLRCDYIRDRLADR
jgi:hypothetical protein